MDSPESITIRLKGGHGEEASKEEASRANKEINGEIIIMWLWQSEQVYSTIKYGGKKRMRCFDLGISGYFLI